MKIYISVDMEGICGISSWKEMEKDVNETRRLMTEEVNAVIRGCFKGNPDITEIVVCDSHDRGENIFPELLDERAYLIKGYPRPYYMMTGIDSSFSLLFLIGYHSKAGVSGSQMDHTYSGATVHEVKINGKSVAEYEINAGLAGYYNVPLALVSGDHILCKTINESMPQVRTVITKEGISRFASLNPHPKKVRELLERESSKAVQEKERFIPLTYKTPLDISIEFNNTLMADYASYIPVVEREGRIIRFQATDFKYFHNMLMALIGLAGLALR